MQRFILFDNLDNPIGELNQKDILSLVRRESINGAHSLEIATVHVLQKGTRVVYKDERGIWREYVVAGVDEKHSAGRTVVGTYYCVWSAQNDLAGVNVSIMPGVQTPVAASSALTSILSTQSRWTRGTVTNTAYSGASMYDTNAWNALSILVKNWGGELDTTINISTLGYIVSRKIDLYAQQGNDNAKRRFDFGADLKSITRKYDDAPFYCRISPRGKGEQTDSGGYGRKITIEDVNDGKDYLEYTPMVNVCKIKSGSGYIYPTLIVENSQCETPSDLLAWAQSVLESYCSPKVTYEIDVIQAAQEGVDVHGVSLGDAVHVVDRKFGANGVRVNGRVVEMSVNELNGKEITVVIGSSESIFSSLTSISTSVVQMKQTLEEMSTAQYVEELLDRLNAEINATGGYTYITQGQGIRTYDKAVTDPTVGAEADAVVEVKGGAIRIANSKYAGGGWKWKTVFTSGHVTAELVTAANLITGYIGSATSGNYWNLDTGELTIKKGSILVKNGSSTIFSANLTSGTATIGGFTVVGNALYSGKSSLTSNTAGVYISTSGISVGSGTAYTALAGGYLRGGTADNITGYVGFNNYWSPTGVYGTRLAGRGCIALLTDGAFGIGSYYSFGSSATIKTGMSGSVKVVTNITMTLPEGSSARWDYKTITFTKGLMTTQL